MSNMVVPTDLLITIWRKLALRDCVALAQTCRRHSISWAADRRLICSERIESEFGFIKRGLNRTLTFEIADPLPDDPCQRYAKLRRARAVLPTALTLTPAAGEDPKLFTFDGLLTLRQACIAAARDRVAWMDFVKNKDRLAFVARAAKAFSLKYEQSDPVTSMVIFAFLSEDVYALCQRVLQTADWQGMVFPPVLWCDVSDVPESPIL